MADQPPEAPKLPEIASPPVPPPKRIWPPDPAGLPAAKIWADDDQPKTLRDKVIRATRKVFDPEIPVNIYDLGLIYKIDIDDAAKRVVVQMTLTTPNCPEAESLPGMVRSEIERIPEVGSAEVVIVWDPPWDKDKMSDEAKLILGID